MPLQHPVMLIPPSHPHLSSPTPLSPLPPRMWKVEEKVQCQFSVHQLGVQSWSLSCGGREASIKTMQLHILLPLLGKLRRKCTSSCVQSRSLSWWERGLHQARAALHPPPSPWQVEEKVHLQLCSEPESELVGERPPSRPCSSTSSSLSSAGC